MEEPRRRGYKVDKRMVMMTGDCLLGKPLNTNQKSQMLHYWIFELPLFVRSDVTRAVLITYCLTLGRFDS